MTIPLRLGYKASAEQFGPNELADFDQSHPMVAARSRCLRAAARWRMVSRTATTAAAVGSSSRACDAAAE